MLVLPACSADTDESGTVREASAQSQQAHEETGHDAAAEDEEHGEEEAELAIYMSRVQRWTHKTALAVDAENGELSEFYLHELEETLETIQMEAPVYEGYEVGKLTNEILVPEVEALDSYVDEGDWSGAREQLTTLSNACNQCHAATDHGFIRIQLEDLDRPFAQSFAPEVQ
ncbi:hypothetical protein CRI94_11600 [Longibacter salinarum]|uniref:Cytochrome c domain-containing protein n=1 Tax=Longibacter salinarum TaxID=1850348 RepID=A0A2A8CXH6_9BACT|nr:hypothetical protein [Longibacter salinarum]PEN13277.1 hypothetical protein CRI94_11600 [Longibacter salinarum]